MVILRFLPHEIFKTLTGMYTDRQSHSCHADKNPYRHDGRADKDTYRHDGLAYSLSHSEQQT